MREWLEHSRSRGMSLGLERVKQALDELNRPDKKMACIHVAGSNGKGSACAQLVGGLARAGYSVGLSGDFVLCINTLYVSIYIRFVRPHRLVRPRTQDFHSCNRGSNPLGVI